MDEPEPSIGPQWLTKKQVASYLQCSMRQVELLTGTGRIAKPVYLGKSSPRWRLEELIASLEAKSPQDSK